MSRLEIYNIFIQQIFDSLDPKRGIFTTLKIFNYETVWVISVLLVTPAILLTEAEMICKLTFYWSVYFLYYGKILRGLSQFESFRQD